MDHSFWKENIKDRVKLLESNILNCWLKITMTDVCKIGLKIVRKIQTHRALFGHLFFKHTLWHSLQGRAQEKNRTVLLYKKPHVKN